MRSLRTRLILSHVVPVMIVIPLIALALYWVLLTLNNVTHFEAALDQHTARLVDQAQLLAETAGQVEEIWADPAFAQRFITGIDLQLTSVALYDLEGNVVAARDGDPVESLGQELSSAEFGTVLSGERTVTLRVRDEAAMRVADAFIPVFDVNNRLTGAIRLSHELADAEQRFRDLTVLLLSVTALLLLLGVGLGLTLALRLERSLTQATTAIYAIAESDPPDVLPGQQITEINLLYGAVNTLVERLASLEAGRKRLLANLVHEIGRPLGSIRAAVHALQQGAVDQPALRDELLGGIDHQLGQLQPLLEDLTELHGQVLGPQELDRRPTPVTPWLQDVATLWREAAQEKGVSWHADVPFDLPAVALDPDQMSRAVGNLLSNAVKFTPPGGTVTLAAAAHTDVEPPTLRIAVADSGPGISPQDQARIFEPFQRGAGDRRFPQGMGLGLAIARDIVHAHGGAIELVSQPGEGATFAIVLPIW